MCHLIDPNPNPMFVCLFVCEMELLDTEKKKN